MLKRSIGFEVIISLAIVFSACEENETSGMFTDTRDNTVYNWVQIGSQVWMAENLAYLQSVNQVADGSEDLAGSYYYVYDYNGTNATEAKATSNYITYGVLYNWEAAKAACPTGWHLPSDDEWKELEMVLGISKADTDDAGWRGTNEGSKLAGNSGLWYGRELVRDEDFGTSGFTALPGGHRIYNGSFYNFGKYGYWWSATEADALNAWYRNVGNSGGGVGRGHVNKDIGFSIRCLKD